MVHDRVALREQKPARMTPRSDTVVTIAFKKHDLWFNNVTSPPSPSYDVSDRDLSSWSAGVVLSPPAVKLGMARCQGGLLRQTPSDFWRSVSFP